MKKKTKLTVALNPDSLASAALQCLCDSLLGLCTAKGTARARRGAAMTGRQ